MSVILSCNDPFNKNCSWSGEQDELVALEGEDKFTHCPGCDGEDFLEESDDDEELD